MKRAFELAEIAKDEGEVPVGAVVVFQNKIIGEGYNRREATNSPISHAEIEAIKMASDHLKSWRLEDCDIYVTLEPCMMCSGAIVQSRIKRLFFGSRDPKAGAVKSLYNLLEDDRLNHQVEVFEGMLAEECSKILTEFFREIRAAQKLKKITAEKKSD